MKKSRRLVLGGNDYDHELVVDQMNQKFIEGLGFSSWNNRAIIDPAEIMETEPGEAARLISKEHKTVLESRSRSK